MNEMKQFHAVIAGIARTERYDEITLQMSLGALNELLEGIGGLNAMSDAKLYEIGICTNLDCNGKPCVTFEMKMKE